MSVSGSRWLVALVSLATALFAFAPGCASTALTELVVVVELGAGLEVPRDLTYATIRVETRAGRLLGESVPFTGPDARGFPLTLGITQREGRADFVEIFVDGYAMPTRPSLSRRVATEFLPGERRVVHIVLERSCYDRECDPGLTCVRGACVDPAVDPRTLPPFTGTLPDAGPPGDVGLDAPPADAAIDATGEPDAGPDAAADAPIDAPRDANEDATTCVGDGSILGMPGECTLTRPPARGTCGDGGDDGLVRTFALLDPVLDQSGGRWATSSIDLDGYCSSPTAMGTQEECDAPMGEPTPPDGPGGVDNVLGQTVYLSILTFLPSFQPDTNRSARRGRSVPIIRISGWNGEANDARVAVQIATAIDVLPEGTDPPAGLVPFDNMLPEPRWDGTDTAYVGRNYFAAGDERFPLVADDNAYVTDHVLVARLPDRAPIDFPVRSGVGRVRLTAPVAMLELSPDGLSISNARMMGRWALVDLLEHLSDIGICPGTPEVDMYLTAFDFLARRVLDVRSVPGSGGVGVPCDAVSTALPFGDAVPVRWGGLQPLDLEPAACP